METILGIFFLCLSLFTLTVYLKAHEHILKKLVKGSVFAFLSVIASGAALTGDFSYSIAIGSFVVYMTYRRLINNKTSSVALDVSLATPSLLQETSCNTDASVVRTEIQRLQAIAKKQTVNCNELKPLRDIERKFLYQQKPQISNVDTDVIISTASAKSNNCKNKKNSFRMVAFSYTDSKGDTTYREVDVKQINANRITGYCHLRHRVRTFCIDRVVSNEIIIRDSGEVMEIDDWLDLA